eukprot:TRINITY_DN36959_c0_g1_i1.p1 TRINITY_DN36959_c0_g1~~TRINITY_DN36959_c0_g1_i1.p1  ORF type:complete len:432 (-),score=83.47 TRINITY_DN36959_c0_g1_i1:13-1308(-)
MAASVPERERVAAEMRKKREAAAAKISSHDGHNAATTRQESALAMSQALARQSARLREVAASAQTTEAATASTSLVQAALEVAANLDALAARATAIEAAVLGGRHAIPAATAAAEAASEPAQSSQQTSSVSCSKTMKGHKEAVLCLAVAKPGGQVVSCSEDKTLRVWDPESGDCLFVLEGHAGDVCGVASLEESRVASASKDRTVKIWNLDDRSCVATLKGHTRGVLAVAGTMHGILSCSQDKTAMLWDVSGRCLAKASGHKGEVSCGTAVGSNHAATGSADKTVRVWKIQDAADASCAPLNMLHVATLEGHTHAVCSVIELHKYAGEDRIASASKDSSVKIWQPGPNDDTWACVATLVGHTMFVRDLAVLDDDRIVSASSDRTLIVWQISNERRLAELKGHVDTVQSVVRVGRSIVSASDDCTVRQWIID